MPVQNPFGPNQPNSGNHLDYNNGYNNRNDYPHNNYPNDNNNRPIYPHDGRPTYPTQGNHNTLPTINRK